MGNYKRDEKNNKESKEEEEEEEEEGGIRLCRKYKIRRSEEGGETILARHTYQEVKDSDRTYQEGDVIWKTLVDEGRGGWERYPPPITYSNTKPK